KENDHDTISNSSIFNFYASGAIESSGVRLDAGNTDWTISGNSFYQTVSRASAGRVDRAIYVNNTSGNNFTVTNNVIGGSATNGAGSWTTTGNSSYKFAGIQLNVGVSTASSIQGNTIKNFTWTSGSISSTPPVWTGIYVGAGAANIGTTAGNTI